MHSYFDAIHEPNANSGMNQGVGSGTNFKVGFYLSTDATITPADKRVGARSVGNLTPGGSSTENTSVTIPTNLAPNTYYWGTIADYNDAHPRENRLWR